MDIVTLDTLSSVSTIYYVNGIYLSGLIVNSGHFSFLGINAISSLGYITIFENIGCSIQLSASGPIDTFTSHEFDVGGVMHRIHCNDINTIIETCISENILDIMIFVILLNLE